MIQSLCQSMRRIVSPFRGNTSPQTDKNYARMREADLVVLNGKFVKHRFEHPGGKTSLPDGCYQLVRIDEGFDGGWAQQ
jgi:hypothetical protein